MVSPKSLVEPNASVDCDGQRALVSGGTQGIGAGIALRYALSGASVYIVGRSEERGKEVLSTLEQASAEYARRKARSSSADHDFFKADLSDVNGIKSVVQKVKEKTNGEGVDHLVMTQGGPPLGALQPLDSGIEKHFAVQCLSRFGLAYLLSSENLVKRSITSVCSPAQGSKQPLDPDDLDLLKAKASGKIWDGFIWGILRKGQRDASVVDAFSQKIAEDHPNLQVNHLFPGAVQTNAAANKGMPAPLAWLSSIFLPLIAQKPGPGGYAEIPFYLCNHPDGLRYARAGEANLYGSTLKRLELSPNVRDKAAREQIWAKLASYF